MYGSEVLNAMPIIDHREWLGEEKKIVIQSIHSIRLLGTPV